MAAQKLSKNLGIPSDKNTNHSDLEYSESALRDVMHNGAKGTRVELSCASDPFTKELKAPKTTNKQRRGKGYGKSWKYDPISCIYGARDALLDRLVALSSIAKYFTAFLNGWCSVNISQGGVSGTSTSCPVSLKRCCK